MNQPLDLSDRGFYSITTTQISCTNCNITVVYWLDLCCSRSVTLKGLNIYADTYFTLCIFLNCHYLEILKFCFHFDMKAIKL